MNLSSSKMNTSSSPTRTGSNPGPSGEEKKLFARYVSQQILGRMGTAAYVLVDTIFLSWAAGANGIAAVNLILPVYSLMDAIGIMMGLGAATRFTIEKARGSGKEKTLFSGTLFFALSIGLVFTLLGLLCPQAILTFLGADEVILEVGLPYLRICLSCGPFFLLSCCIPTFVRNDGSPEIVMAATILSSLFNIAGDYIFMFPMHMGIAGAALATGLSPLLSILICGLHWKKKDNHLHLRPFRPSLHQLFRSMKLGFATAFTELSAGVTLMVFNYLFLRYSGNLGLAAYSIVANYALIATSIFNGLAEGVQPLISRYYGEKKGASEKIIFRLGLGTSLGISVLMLALAVFFRYPLASVFNPEGIEELTQLSIHGMILYFIGYLPASINLLGVSYLSARELAREASLISLIRGCVASIACALLMSWLWQLDGIWWSFAAAECITLLIFLMILMKGPFRTMSRGN